MLQFPDVEYPTRKSMSWRDFVQNIGSIKMYTNRVCGKPSSKIYLEGIYRQHFRNYRELIKISSILNANFIFGNRGNSDKGVV